MKASILAVSLLSAAAIAAPAPEAEATAPHKYWGNKGGHKGWKGGKKEDCDPLKGFPIPFTSTYSVKATPGQVVDSANAYTGGLPGSYGLYDYGINSELDIICYYIRLYNFQGEYSSPAKTATHIHEGVKGKAGPPRIAFPNPQPVAGKDYRVSAGCLTGPFTTGVTNNATGLDTGDGFKVAQIESNPKGFFTDVHSSKAVPGAVRGQLG